MENFYIKPEGTTLLGRLSSNKTERNFNETGYKCVKWVRLRKGTNVRFF
jgi:hypothetical protein